ncbi:uncharacterized protein [Antedon mediterranea]|uniref:uncharacterized protein n=1 Tax=Antedon mediterranea TaxID=105859 RepID=UPI003AF4E23A
MANRWFEFCERKNCDIISPHVTLPLEFLSDMFNSGLSYSSINTARSMLSSLFAVGQEYASFGQLPIVKRFMKGIFPLEFNAFPSDKKLCIVSLLTEYLSCTSVFRQDKAQLLLSYISPHKPISKDTVSHWVKKFMCNAGIDTVQYKPHSTRSASASHLLNKNVDLNNIMKSAGWAKEETFQKYYIHIAPPTFNYGTAVLESCSSEK